RDQLLHLRGDLLHGRRLPRRRDRGAESAPLRVLHLLLPAPDRRADRPLPKARAAAPQLLPARPGAHALGPPPLLARAREEGADRRPTRPADRPAARPPRLDGRLAGLGRRPVLRVPDLLRLRRLLRHGPRARPHGRHRAAVELRPALPGAQPARVLAPLERDTLELAPRLRLHPARWQPPRRAPARREPARDDGDRRPLARRVVHLPRVGPLARDAPRRPPAPVEARPPPARPGRR